MSRDGTGMVPKTAEQKDIDAHPGETRLPETRLPAPVEGRRGLGAPEVPGAAEEANRVCRISHSHPQARGASSEGES